MITQSFFVWTGDIHVNNSSTDEKNFNGMNGIRKNNRIYNENKKW